jgi:hypothetical protein
MAGWPFWMNSLCATTFASLGYRCEWVYDVVDDNRDTMRKEGEILSKKKKYKNQKEEKMKATNTQIRTCMSDVSE